MRALIAALCLLFATPAALAQTADEVSGRINMLFGDAQYFEMAFVAIQGAVTDGDAEYLASWVAYPITINPGTDEEWTVETPEDFVASYGDIMTDEIYQAVTGQAYENLFVNDQGVMFGNGQLWMTAICQDDTCAGFDVKIVTIQTTAQ
jgi:hypothetical protein